MWPFDHLGVDECHAMLASYRYPVVAILDEINVADLVELNRREHDVLVVGAVDALPTVGGVLALGQKSAVEIAKSIDAADDLVDRHLLHPAIALTLHGDTVAHIGVGEERCSARA